MATRTFQPKKFYRELDRLLGEVEGGGLYAEWFPWIVSEIVERFGPYLSITAGRLHVEEDGRFAARDPEVPALPGDEPPAALVSEHGVYLFNATTAVVPSGRELGAADTAGVLVEGDPRRILAFRLAAGWSRDDLDFALNTIRNAVHDRMTFQDMKSDLEQAAEIQRSLLPTEAPALAGFTIAARSISATTVGGDFYDFFALDPETVLLALGDASGHGLAAALLARDVVTGIRMGSERALKITDTVARLNRVIGRSAMSSRFVSLFYSEVEENGNVFYVNAGHPPAWLLGERGVRRLDRGGTILGPVENAAFRRGFAHVDRGDTLVIVTDGFLERVDGRGRLFGDEGVERAVSPRAGQDAGGILDALFDAARRHGRGRPWADDTTAIVVSRAPGP